MLPPMKSLLACASVFLALAVQTSAHAIPSPALGIKGDPVRKDTQRPTDAKPCGNVDIASNLDTSTAIPAAADGSVTMNVQHFNAGKDGSTSVTVKVDQTGTGKNFVDAKVTKNGNTASATKLGTDKIIFSLPAGTKCSGGKAKNLCLVTVKSISGFGGCTVVSQGAKAAADPTKTKTAGNPKQTGKNQLSAAALALADKQLDKKHINDTCTVDADCRQGCCGFTTGRCSGPRISQLNKVGGCGHSNPAPNCDVASLVGSPNCVKGAKNGNLQSAAVQQAAAFAAKVHKLAFTPGAPAPAKPATAKPAAAKQARAAKQPTIAQLAAKQQSKKTVFETCAHDRECQQGCCGFSTGKCAGPDVAQTNGSGGCGRGHASPNCNVATVLGFKNCIKGSKNGDLHRPLVQQAAAFAAQLDGLSFKPNVQKPKRDLESKGFDALARRQTLQQGKFVPRVLKAREAELEIEAREAELESRESDFDDAEDFDAEDFDDEEDLE
ncbi:hypothetical protein R3P38DRAFT_3547066 [Favolaschia claudopus]|uniref:Uncharacterized protein n=1 Tax=Favolaschia claudopus TaxID=2862362 RepID=A0AAW0DYM8_9AGAR